MPARSYLAGLAVLAALAGCAGVPSAGTVRVGRVVQPVGGGNGGEDIRVVAGSAIPGEAPALLVREFLRTMVDSSQGYSAARVYLAPETSWSPGAGITLYDDAGLQVRRTGERTVDVTARRIGTIDPRGRFQPRGGQLHRTFTLVKRFGRWRISALASGVLLSSSDAAQSLQSLPVYYLNQAQDTVVPEQLLVAADQQGLATTLMQALLAGPGDDLAPGVRTAVPHGATLVGNVPIDSHGVAEVSLAGAVRQLPPQQLVRLSAQVVWTLQQVPDVSAVRLLDDGTPLDIPELGASQPVGSWSGFDPDALAARQGSTFLRDGRVAAVGAAVPKALAGIAAIAATVSAGGSEVAALQPQRRGRTLLAGPAAGPLRSRLAAPAITPPAFGPGGLLYVGTAGPGGTRLLQFGSSGRATPVTLPDRLRHAPVQALAISPDGARIALVAGAPGAGELLVGVIGEVRDAPALLRVHRLLPADRDVAGVGWVGASQIVVTADGTTGRRVLVEIGPTGYAPRTLPTTGLPSQPRQVAATPGQPVLAAASGAVWALTGNQWVRLSTGSDPSYAG